MDFHVYGDFFNHVDGALTSYVGDTASNVIDAISPVTQQMFILYVMLWGWLVMRGAVQELVLDGASRILRVGFILGIALNLGRYNTYVGDFFWQAPDALAAVVSGSDSDAVSTVNFLDNLFGQIYDVGNAYWQQASILNGNFGYFFLALGIWGAGIFATGYACFLVVLAKLFIACLLALGPIFIIMLFFESTKRLFDTWMGQLLNYMFMVVLTASVVKLILGILNAFVPAALAASEASADGPSMAAACSAMMLCIISGLVLLQVPSVASALGGGVAASTLGAVGYAYGRAKNTMGGLRPTAIRREKNRAMADLRIMRDTAKSAAAAPQAVYRRITGSDKNRVARA